MRVILAITFHDVRQRNIVDSITLNNVRHRNIIDSITFRNVRRRNIVEKLLYLVYSSLFLLGVVSMTEHGMYFASKDFYNLIRNNGGQWNDSKERPIVCLIKSNENDKLYWAIPVGNWDHRNVTGKRRIMSYINSNPRKIQSCFYHIGNTTVKSIFFISDAVPITDKYIDREYLGYDNNQYVVLNPTLISELDRKLKRILSFESSNPNFFRQHITDVKKCLLDELP